MDQQPLMFDDDAILSLTNRGKHEIHEAGTSLPPALLEVLILIDGHTNLKQILKRAVKLDPNVLRDNLKYLIDHRMVLATAKPVSELIEPGDFFSINTSKPDLSMSGSKTQAEADDNAKFLQQNGYYVNIARRRANQQELADGHIPTVLVIDDDPDICKLIQMCLKLENIHSNSAANREEIVTALRKKPLPDMILLDVHLLDVNGFDVLASIRQHPSLKELPVVMLTASSTREAVLRGILGGADGYITKPFEIHPMLRAVKTALGLKINKSDKDWDYSL